MAGLIIHREYFDFRHDKQIDFYKQARGIIDNLAFSWIGPVFFVTLGSKLIFDVDAFYTLMLTTFLLNMSVPPTIRWWKATYGAPN